MEIWFVCLLIWREELLEQLLKFQTLWHGREVLDFLPFGFWYTLVWRGYSSLSYIYHPIVYRFLPTSISISQVFKILSNPFYNNLSPTNFGCDLISFLYRVPRFFETIHFWLYIPIIAMYIPKPMLSSYKSYKINSFQRPSYSFQNHMDNSKLGILSVSNFEIYWLGKRFFWLIHQTLFLD